jgi:hypothetical protein
MPNTSVGWMCGGRTVQCLKSGHKSGSKWSPVVVSGLILGLRVPGSVESGTVSGGLIISTIKAKNAVNSFIVLVRSGFVYTWSARTKAPWSTLKRAIDQGDMSSNAACVD